MRERKTVKCRKDYECYFCRDVIRKNDNSVVIVSKDPMTCQLYSVRICESCNKLSAALGYFGVDRSNLLVLASSVFDRITNTRNFHVTFDIVLKRVKEHYKIN